MRFRAQGTNFSNGRSHLGQHARTVIAAVLETCEGDAMAEL